MSATEDQTVVVAIAGFTGKVARLITNGLLRRHPNAVVHGICRSPDKVDTALKSHPRVKIFQAASDDYEALQKGLEGADICICAYLGDNALMVEGQKLLVDACIASKVPRYMASDWCLDYRSLNVGDHPNKDAMILVRSYIEQKEKAGQIWGVHILNGVLMEVAWAPFLGWCDVESGKFWYYGTGDELLDMTSVVDVAEFSAEVAYDKAAKGFINIIGDQTSIKGMARAFAQVYGAEPIVERKGSLEELYIVMKEVFAQKQDDPLAWMGMHYLYYMANGSTALGRPLANDRYKDVELKTTEEFLENHDRKSVGNVFFNL